MTTGEPGLQETSDSWKGTFLRPCSVRLGGVLNWEGGTVSGVRRSKPHTYWVGGERGPKQSQVKHILGSWPKAAHLKGPG